MSENQCEEFFNESDKYCQKYKKFIDSLDCGGRKINLYDAVQWTIFCLWTCRKSSFKPFNLFNHLIFYLIKHTIQRYFRWNTSNHILSEEKRTETDQ